MNDTGTTKILIINIDSSETTPSKTFELNHTNWHYCISERCTTYFLLTIVVYHWKFCREDFLRFLIWSEKRADSIKIFHNQKRLLVEISPPKKKIIGIHFGFFDIFIQIQWKGKLNFL